jgi:hypothetical protein
MRHPKDIGDRTVLAVMLALHERGYVVLVPFGDNTRYDLIIEDGNTMSRVQCKTGRLLRGAVRFPACSSYAHHANPAAPSRDYAGQIDYFGVHCPSNHAVYLVPLEDAPVTREVALRVEPALNGQSRRIRAAAAYEIARVAVTPAACSLEGRAAFS